LVAFVGGHGGAAVATAIALTAMPDLQVTFITSASDDGGSTGRLRMLENVAGYYSDVMLVIGALRSAVHPKGFSDMLAVRLTAGIPKGELFIDFIASWFSEAFAKAIKDPRYRQQTIDQICKIFHIDALDEVGCELLHEAMNYRFAGDDFREHTPRNIMLFLLERAAQRRGLPLSHALRVMHAIYAIPDNFQVLPVTWEPAVLNAKTVSGVPIDRQYFIDFRTKDPNFRAYDEIAEVKLVPPVTAAEEVLHAISLADAFLIGCGSINGNFKAQFGVKKVRDFFWMHADAFETKTGSPIPVIHTLNLLNEPGDTVSGKPFTAAHVVDVIQRTIGMRPNCIIYDKTQLSDEEEQHLLPKKKIKLGHLKGHPTAFFSSSLLQYEISKMVRNSDPNQPWECIHDPAKLAVVLKKVLSAVMAGALA
jgi:2-phospho-L-lactate transferase/gluconeogenesis factor (CofD/UPF0052 family)